MQQKLLIIHFENLIIITYSFYSNIANNFQYVFLKPEQKKFKLLTFSLYSRCVWGKCSKCPLHVSKLENGELLSSDNQICFDGCDWFKVCLKEQLWLVDLHTVWYRGNPTQIFSCELV